MNFSQNYTSGRTREGKTQTQKGQKKKQIETRIKHLGHYQIEIVIHNTIGFCKNGSTPALITTLIQADLLKH